MGEEVFAVRTRKRRQLVKWTCSAIRHVLWIAPFAMLSHAADYDISQPVTFGDWYVEDFYTTSNAVVRQMYESAKSQGSAFLPILDERKPNLWVAPGVHQERVNDYEHAYGGYYLHGEDPVYSFSDRHYRGWLREDCVLVTNVFSRGDPDKKPLASAYFVAGYNPNERPESTESGRTKEVVVWDNLVVVADGFDPGGDRTFREILLDPNFSLLLSKDADSPLGRGYDLCFVDFADGGADIRYNAKLFMLLLARACGGAKDHDAEVTVGGFSMGGLVARLALLYGHKEGWDVKFFSNVKKYLWVDTPHQGANINLGAQAIVHHYRNVNPQAWNELNRPAARQMLYEFAVGSKSEHTQFYEYINNDSWGGYPRNMKTYSIVDGNFEKPYPNTRAGAWGFTWKLGTWEKKVYLTDTDLLPGSHCDLFGMLEGNEPVQNFYLEWFLSSFVNTFTGGFPVLEKSTVNSGYKPTFIPARSAADIREDGSSPFDEVHTMESTLRQHVDFDEDMMEKILMVLEDGETGVVSLDKMLHHEIVQR